MRFFSNPDGAFTHVPPLAKRLQCTVLLQLGLEPYHGVGILGFNSPEWLISDLGAIMAGYVYGTVVINNCPVKSTK